MSSFQNLLLNKINQATPLFLHCQSGTGLSDSQLHSTEFQFCFLVTELNICCTSVCTVYMEEGKENWQNIDDAFQWLRRCTHEAGDSVVVCTRLTLHFPQPPTLTCLSHKPSLLCTITYWCLRMVANSLSRKEVMFKRKSWY